MSEAKILQAIADRVRDDRLHFQVIAQDDSLHVYINRDTEEELDYQQLTEDIYSAIVALEELDLAEIGLYSRILGEIEPDWQTFVEVREDATPIESLESMAEDINSAAKNTNSLIAKIEREFDTPEEEVAAIPESENSSDTSDSSDSSNPEELPEEETVETVEKIGTPEAIKEDAVCDSEELPEEETIDPVEEIGTPETASNSAELEIPKADYSQYCFIRNKSLLNADLVVPAVKIAQIISTLDNFDESLKRSQLPLLESYFKSDFEPDIEEFETEIQAWWQDIQQLDSNPKRKLAIWLSRYCLDPATTIATVESVFEAKLAAQKAAEEAEREKARQEREARNSDRQTERHNTFDTNTSQGNSFQKEAPRRSKAGFNLSSGLKLPITWILVTLVVIIVGINSTESASQLPAICEGNNNQDYCHLAVQIAGKEIITEKSENTAEFKEESLEFGLMYCQVYANTAAGIPLRESDPLENPPLSTSGSEIFPGTYLADIEQTNTKNGNPTVRTACLIEQTKARNIQRSINILSAEQIDPDWPEVPYEPSAKMNSVRSFQKASSVYSTLGWFGLNTFYTAISLYVLAICGMAIKAYSLNTIYQASFILGIVEGILGMLPVLGWWIIIPVECVALGITSGCVKGFKVDWAAGYPFVAASALVLIATRALLCWLTLASLVFFFS